MQRVKPRRKPRAVPCGKERGRLDEEVKDEEDEEGRARRAPEG